MHDGNPPLLDVMGRQWRMKLCVSVFLALFYCTGYELIERHPWRPPVEFALTAIDRWTGFSPRWVGVYQSIYLMLPALLLATTRDQVRRYGFGFAALTLVGFACFILWPVRGPRPHFAPDTGMYGLLTRIDLPLNSFPSMHVAIATYSACFAIHLTQGRLKRILMVALPIWVLLIAYSALATKQHYLVDLPPGALLGWAAHRLAWQIKRSP
jgi:membrane-associated phospholipid phosphatase